MSYPINPKITPYQPQLTGLSSQSIPNMDGVKQDINSTPVAKVAQNDNMGVVAGLMLPIWYGVSKLMDKFNRSCADKADGSKNTLQKIGDFGDKIGNHKLLKNGATEKFGGFWKKVKNVIRKQVVDKSAIVRSMVDTPSVPTNKMALTQSRGTLGEVANDAASMIGKYTNSGKDLEKVAELGFKDYKKVMASPSEHMDEIIEACRKRGGQEFVDRTSKGRFQPVRNLFGRKMYWSEIANKLEALKGLDNTKALPATSIGKILPRTSLRVLESLTNGTAGGKFAIFMQAYILADAVVRTYKAPKGEKGKTFAENIIYNSGWYLAMPLSINLMHNVGGLQYLGMKDGKAAVSDLDKVSFKELKKEFKKTKNQAEFDAGKKLINEKADEALKNFRKEGNVKNYRTAVNAINESVVAGGFDKKEAEYKAIIKEFKTAFKGNVKWYQRPFKTVGKLVTTGLEHFRPFVKTTESDFLKHAKNIKFNMKNASGSIIRVGLFMAVIAPFFGKLSAKASHLIFGKPTKSVLDDEPSEEKAPQPAAGQAATAPATTAAPVKAPTTPAPVKAPIAPQPPVQAGGSLINKEALKTQANPFVTTPPKASEPARTYIPSSAGVKIQANSAQPQPGQPNNGSDKVNSALNRANAAEQEALKYLSGH